MISRDVVLILSICLFSMGIIGALTQRSIIKIIISTEIILFASIINFCYFAGNNIIKSGHFAALIAIVLSGLSISVIYTLITMQLRQKIQTQNKTDGLDV